MKKLLGQLLCVLMVAGLVGCSSSPPIRYFSLDDGESPELGSPDGARIAIVQVNLPELIDRSQLVVRTSGHRVQVSEQDRWAEPLRRQLPRLLARDLGLALNSSRVITLPVNARNFDADYKLTLDIQRLEVVLERSVELDVVWRMESRDGQVSFGRSLVWEAIAPGTDSYVAVVESQRKAFKELARQLATEITKKMNGGGQR